MVTDGLLGYAQEVYNSGRMHINRSVLSKSLTPLSGEWNRHLGGGRFWHLLPRRFNNSFNLRYY
ncbi:hypothetical protein [Tenacibaculum maritimum]|uniref:hypothetical protein n=1 Tax=Tenacibaculum maritimum TaxID=107401 RepID=UPI0038779BAD